MTIEANRPYSACNQYSAGQEVLFHVLEADEWKARVLVFFSDTRAYDLGEHLVTRDYWLWLNAAPL